MSESRPIDLLDMDKEGGQQYPFNQNSFSKQPSELAQENDQRISQEEILRHYPTRDEKVYKLLEVVRTVATTKVPLLVTGESGVGKETFSKAIHIASGKDRGRFIVANCASLPQNFFEMEIFASNKNHGEFGQNNRFFETCSLMLDEVTQLDTGMQAKLLKILQEQDVNKNLIKKGTAADARIIACTNKNIHDEVAAGHFRNDLFFKLHVIQLDIPPLRMRQIDVEYYADLFIREFNSQFSKNVQLSPTAKQALRTYTWPGNIRELKNVIQRSVLLAKKDYVGIEDLHLIKTNSRTEVAMGEPLPQITLKELEQRLILQTLRRMNGNRTHTAKALGISLRALRYKLNELVDCGFEVEGKNV